MFLHAKGSPSADVWVLVDQPYKGDEDKGFVFSSGYGYMWDKMMADAGLDSYYVTAYRADLDHPEGWAHVEGSLNHYKPRIIIPLDAVGKKLCHELQPKRRDKNYSEEEDSEISKYAGSLLISPKLSYEHYVIPTLAPHDIARQYKQRDIVVSCDLGKARSELDYFRCNGRIQPLPKRTTKIDFESFDELLAIIKSFKEYPLISNDIETIYPRDKSVFKGIHPGYPLTVGLAPTKDFGISFNLFRDSTTETVELWRVLDDLFRNVPQLGQNFFSFDANYYEALGFKLRLDDCVDTLIRHHVLWPEMQHKLQFQTRQYTREPYYKDEGHGWSIKDMRGLKRYNCLDVCVTMEIFEEQEKEFAERPHLR